MSKGLKMEAARKKNAGELVFNIQQLNKSDNKNLKCKFCDAEVQYISAHMRKSSSTPVDAYLKLWQDEDHDDDCDYSIFGVLRSIVSESNAIEDISPIFQSQEDGSYISRMNILVEAQKIAKDILSADNDAEHLNNAFIGRTYVRNEHELASYFRSASGIVKLRGLIQESQDIELLTKLIKIQYKDDFISWNNFYYDESRYQDLFNRLNKEKIYHPIAMNLTIKGEINYFEVAKYCPWSFQCYSQVTERKGVKLIYIPKILFGKERFSNNLVSHDTLLVVGDVWASKVKDEKSFYRNLNISVFNQSQFKKELS